MTSFASVLARNKAIVKRVSSITGLKDSNLLNGVLEYARCLCEPEKEHILEPVFSSQLSKTFRINCFLHNEIYRVTQDLTSEKPGLNCVTLLQYIVLVSIFLTPDIFVKARYVFQVYDFNKDGLISLPELKFLCKQCIMSSKSSSLDEDDMEEANRSIREIVDIVLNLCDGNNDQTIQLDEWLATIKKDHLKIELLGQCLPNFFALEELKRRMAGKSPSQVTEEFSEERRNCFKISGIGEKSRDKTSKYYPFPLEFEN